MQPARVMAFSVSPVPSVHLSPRFKPTDCPSHVPEKEAQFQAVEYRQTPRPKSRQANAVPGLKSKVLPPIETLPLAGRQFCFEVKWKRSSLQGMTTLSVSWSLGCSAVSCAERGLPPNAGLSTRTRGDP